MDPVSVLVAAVVGFVSLIIFHIVYMSWNNRLFKKLGIPGPDPWPAVGNFPDVMKMGMFNFHKYYYMKYDTEKVYGFHDPGRPIMVIRDLDMVRDILVKNFNNFVNKRVFSTEKPFSNSITQLQDDHWRDVRHAISPTFSSGKLKRMYHHVEESSKSLTSHLRNFCKSEEPIDVKRVVSCYAMDVIASTGFGVKVDSLNDTSNRFVREAFNVLDNITGNKIAFAFLFPYLMQHSSTLGISLFTKETREYFSSFIDSAMESRVQSDSTRQDFVQLVIEASKMKDKSKTQENGVTKSGDEGQPRKQGGMSQLDIQGQAFIFILAGYDTISSVLGFLINDLAHHPDICAKLQEEIDTVLEGKFPTYESVQKLPYMEMCLNETIRMYPPGFILDRICSKDCEVGGVKIPKGMAVIIPVIGIHHDPKHFPEPEKYDPERFTPENKAKRHPFAHLPFGQGPRICIGMRLALMEMKIALANILQEMTPVPCAKSVYPPKIAKFRLVTVDGLWVKMVPRKE